MASNRVDPPTPQCDPVQCPCPLLSLSYVSSCFSLFLCRPNTSLLIVYSSLSLIRLRGPSREANIALLEAVNRKGEMFLIHTELEGRHTLR